jgi:hypothetical protein
VKQIKKRQESRFEEETRIQKIRWKEIPNI